MVTKLATPESREAFWRNVEIMTMRTDMNLGIALDAPFGEALLPLSPDELFHALHAVELHSLQNMARELLATSTTIAGTFAATAPQSRLRQLRWHRHRSLHPSRRLRI